MFNKILIIFLIVVFSRSTVFGNEEDLALEPRRSTKNKATHWCSYIMGLLGCSSPRDQTVGGGNVSVVCAFPIQENEPIVVCVDQVFSVGGNVALQHQNIIINVGILQAASGSELEGYQDSESYFSADQSFDEEYSDLDSSSDTDRMYREAILNQRKREGYQVVPVSGLEDFWGEYRRRNDDEFCGYDNITDGDLTNLANMHLNGTFSSCNIGHYGKFFCRNESENLLFEIPEWTRWYAKINRNEVIGFLIEDRFYEHENQPSSSLEHGPKKYMDLFVHSDWQ